MFDCYILTRCLYLFTCFSHDEFPRCSNSNLWSSLANFLFEHTQESERLFVLSHSHTLQIVFRMAARDICDCVNMCTVDEELGVLKPARSKLFVKQKFENILSQTLKTATETCLPCSREISSWQIGKQQPQM